jgi:hypothetical protein
LRADRFITLELDRVNRFGAPQQRDATAGDNPFLDCSARGVQRIFDARFFFLHLNFR